MEKVVLVGFGIKNKDSRSEIIDSLKELENLSETAGAITEKIFFQMGEKYDSKYVLGIGKIQEIADYCFENNIKTIIFDFELHPSVQKNIAERTNCKILDRTSLILDIFAKRARTKEGKMQVELATLKYLAPRLKGVGASMMQQTGGVSTKGGIGTKGPGEKKLEMDLRVIKDKIVEINKKIEKLREIRALHRAKRESIPVPIVGLVGYTNAGKSTLLKCLTGKEVYIDDKLFTTLDPLTKTVVLPSGFKVLFTDTVGFIKKLPHQLVEAFKSTLEEILKSDLILEILDTGKENFKKDQIVVNEVLSEIKADKIEKIIVYNKIDLLKNKKEFILNTKNENTAYISSTKKIGINDLLEKVENKLKNLLNLYKIHIDYKNYNILNFIRENGFIKSEKYKSKYIELEFYIDKKYYNNIMKFTIK